MTKPGAPHRPETGPDLAQAPLQNAIMIAWRDECFRSSATGRAFDVPVHYIWFDMPRTRWGTIRRYLKSVIATVALVRRTRPEMVLAINLPAVLPLVLWLTALLYRHKLVLDFHSGALTNPLWKRFKPLYQRIVRKAPFTLAHNPFDAEVLEGWGGRAVQLVALPRVVDGVARQEAPEKARLFCVCSFQPDEPVEIMLEAMRACPQITFEMTGNYRKAGLNPQDMPPNVTLLGFVDRDTYMRRMAAASGVITLSDRPDIMQMAVHEAISVGVPVLTNPSRTLAPVLEDAGVFAEIEAEALAAGMQQIAAQAVPLRQAMRGLFARRVADGQAQLDRARASAPTLFKAP